MLCKRISDVNFDFRISRILGFALASLLETLGAALKSRVTRLRRSWRRIVHKQPRATGTLTTHEDELVTRFTPVPRTGRD